MLQHQPQELCAGHGAPFQLHGLAVAITEADLAGGAGEDVFLGDDAPVKIAPQIDERLLARAHGFAIHHPRHGVMIWQGQSSRFDARQQLRPEHFGQRLGVEQIAIFCLVPPLGAPLPALAVDRRRRHDQMDMRVVIQPPRVGVQHRDGTGHTLQLFVIVAEGAHRLPSAAQEQIVDDARVRPAQRPEFGGQGKGQQKVLGWHLLLHLAFQPLLTLMVLAVGAVAMSAGVRHQLPMVTFRALDLHLRAGSWVA